ncbi:MAG: homoserine dehydrogenase [Planctomycetota bacterium]|jgi:homoserine O-acetyltransferase
MDERRELWWESPTVELGKVVALDLPEPFRCVYGGQIPEIQVSYEAWGELNPERDNVVLLAHALTSDCHATGEYAGQPPGWWEPLIGPGRAVDTDRYYVICPNLIGGCYGTTGPRFPGLDGETWYWNFPLLTPLDMMRVQRLFLRALGIQRLALVIGPSMGGMIAWEWAVEAAAEVDRVAVVAAPVVTTPHQIGLNWLQRRGIELDITENEVVARFGQWLARGVGMLSYRSPVGLEEKFGREWFKKPGTTLGERGMFNIESWLRQHGRRITKRFDPYTYLLHSRAMDLHDVSYGRGKLVGALDQVSCRVLVVGISTDNLYPPQDVHLGADILNHLGKQVRYAEIRSLHGHDAVFLETEQIAGMLRDFEIERPQRVPTRVEREVKKVRVGILGAGQVAASFVGLVAERQSDLRDTYGLDIEVRAVAELDPDKKLDPAFEGMEVSYDLEKLVDRPDLDVIVELTKGVGAHALVERALAKRRPVVSPNKPLIRKHGEELERLAFESGVRLAYHDSIAAGWPLMYALERPLSRGSFTAVQAVLSSTCNLILERMTDGTPLKVALSEAIDRGLTEPDPDLDLSGWDTAVKLTLLMTRALGRRFPVDELHTVGITELDPVLVRTAADRNLRIKLVAYAEMTDDPPQATVQPMAVPADGHLGAVRGGNHIVVLRTRDEGETVHIGPAAGTLPVATAVLNDLLGLMDPDHSWTGRYPAAPGGLPRPYFERHLILRDGRPTVVNEPVGIPLLD